VTIAALIGTLLLVVLMAFQLALALGAPWGAAAWGGRNPGVLPTGLRVASAFVGVVVYPLIALVILAAGGAIADDWLPIGRTVVMWILAAFFVLGTVVNAISRSPIERIWAAVSLALAVCCAVIALA
jgi:hypothetical protein